MRPAKPTHHPAPITQHPTNLLFICSRNKWRSPTAEAIYRNAPGMRVRSAGISKRAARTVSIDDLHWADLILVMERKHAQRLRAAHPQLWRFKRSYVLDIPDEFHFMDSELVARIRLCVDPILKNEMDPTVKRRHENCPQK